MWRNSRTAGSASSCRRWRGRERTDIRMGAGTSGRQRCTSGPRSWKILGRPPFGKFDKLQKALQQTLEFLVFCFKKKDGVKIYKIRYFYKHEGKKYCKIVEFKTKQLYKLISLDIRDNLKVSICNWRVWNKTCLLLVF